MRVNGIIPQGRAMGSEKVLELIRKLTGVTSEPLPGSAIKYESDATNGTENFVADPACKSSSLNTEPN